MIEILGWVSQILFGICAIPQAYMSFRQGHSRGLSHALLWCWFFGEGLSIIYGYIKDIPLPIMCNYLLNFTCLCVIMKFRYFERRYK